MADDIDREERSRLSRSSTRRPQDPVREQLDVSRMGVGDSFTPSNGAEMQSENQDCSLCLQAGNTFREQKMR
jgi:hypothetical protein